MRENNENERSIFIGGNIGNIAGNILAGNIFGDTFRNEVINDEYELEELIIKLKKQIIELKRQIINESSLKSKDKNLALELVENLEKASNNPENKEMKKQAKRAILALKGLISDLSYNKQLLECFEHLSYIIDITFDF